MIIDITEALIKESERLYLNQREAHFPGQDLLRRYIAYPFLMIYKGLGFPIKEMMIYCFFYFVGLVSMPSIISLIPNEAPVEVRQIMSSILIYAFVSFPVFMALFLPPSAFSGGNMNKNIIKTLMKKIEYEQISGVSELLNVYEDIAVKRVKTIKRLLALGWAVFLYIFELSKQSFLASNIFSEEDAMRIAIYLVVLFFAFLCVQSYSVSIMLIMENIKVALIEKRHAIR